MTARIKTTYPGVYYRETKIKGGKGAKKVFYIVYRNGRKVIEQKMEYSTDAFSLLDAKLRMVEMNEAALRLFPAGTRKEDLLGKNLEEFAPGAKERGDIERFSRVLKTGEPLFMDRIVPLKPIGTT